MYLSFTYTDFPESDCNSLNSNGIVFLIALMRHTGWKKKRIEDFLLTLNTTMDEYHKHCLDNVFDYMAGKELAEIGIDMEQLLPKPLPFKQQLHKSTIERKAKIDISEVKNLQAEMSGSYYYFRGYISAIASQL